MRAATAFLCLIAVSGCTPAPNPFSFSGTAIDDLFPFDGDRTWEFINTDELVSFKLIAQMRAEAEDLGEKSAYYVDYSVECVQPDPDCVTGEILRSVQWSSSATDGVYVHKYSLDGVETVLDSPIQISNGTAKKDEFVTTTTNGATWTSTLIGFETCPVRMNVDWPECGHFLVEADNGDGAPLAGDYWANAGFNVVSMELPWDLDRWELSKHECDGDCNGVW